MNDKAPSSRHFLRLFAPIACVLTLWVIGNAPAAGYSIEPRRPEVPVALPESGLTNPVDLLLAPYFKEHKIEPGDVISDRIFARRVFLDLVGLLPSTQQLEFFVNDMRPEKRALLVRELLNDQRAYADHWLAFWNDALRNAYRGTGFIDDGRSQITGWLYQSLYDNKPYDRFVHELISPVEGSEGFVQGIIWRGVVNASQRRELQAAQNISQVFLGANLKCASCHDSFVNHWLLSDAYGLANVFADQPLEIYRCNKPTGEIAEVRFLFPELGQIDASAPRTERMKQLADLVVSPRNGRLTRTIVNRLWARLLGRGLLEPVDNMDNDPWSRDVLDWLAVDLADHRFDLKHTLEQICTSRAYQLPAVGAPKPNESDYIFRGPLVKRMSAEQFVDAMAPLTGVWPKPAGDMLARDGRGQGGQLLAVRNFRTSSDALPSDALSQTKWIWNTPDAAKGAPGGRLHLRKTITLTDEPSRVHATVACDNEFVLFVNGKKFAEGKTWKEPFSVDLTGQLHAGDNVIAVDAVNQPLPKENEKVDVAKNNPAGFIFVAIARKNDAAQWSVGSDESWLCSPTSAPGWETLKFDSAGWTHAVAAAPIDGPPWGLENPLRAAIGVQDQPVRSSLQAADPLTRALGQPNREQVVTSRDSWSTMLQALELTNGTTLDAILQKGADQWFSRNDIAGEQLIDAIYTTALGRAPSSGERTVAAELVGSPPMRDGIADLLWALTMLPEFQLIY
ncbi:MAG: DUF1549 domain-containing protein [Planctomycetaceae bacterium]